MSLSPPVVSSEYGEVSSFNFYCSFCGENWVEDLYSISSDFNNGKYKISSEKTHYHCKKKKEEIQALRNQNRTNFLSYTRGRGTFNFCIHKKVLSFEEKELFKNVLEKIMKVDNTKYGLVTSDIIGIDLSKYGLKNIPEICLVGDECKNYILKERIRCL